MTSQSPRLIGHSPSSNWNRKPGAVGVLAEQVVVLEAVLVEELVELLAEGLHLLLGEVTEEGESGRFGGLRLRGLGVAMVPDQYHDGAAPLAAFAA